MQRSVRFHPAALQDADEAAAWYAERSLRAAVRFLDELDRLIDVIAVSPDRFQSFDADLRRAVFRRFPFYIVFRRSQRCRPCSGTWEETPTILAGPRLKSWRAARQVGYSAVFRPPPFVYPCLLISRKSF